jgi:hypothetical protein
VGNKFKANVGWAVAGVLLTAALLFMFIQQTAMPV